VDALFNTETKSRFLPWAAGSIDFLVAAQIMKYMSDWDEGTKETDGAINRNKAARRC